MRLIDRYVFSLFLKVFLVCFLSLTGIYIVGDFVGNLNEFIEAADQQGSLVSLLTTYYGARVPWFFDLIGRVVALIAAVFAVSPAGSVSPDSSTISQDDRRGISLSTR